MSITFVAHKKLSAPVEYSSSSRDLSEQLSEGGFANKDLRNGDFSTLKSMVPRCYVGWSCRGRKFKLDLSNISFEGCTLNQAALESLCKVADLKTVQLKGARLTGDVSKSQFKTWIETPQLKTEGLVIDIKSWTGTTNKLECLDGLVFTRQGVKSYVRSWSGISLAGVTYEDVEADGELLIILAMRVKPGTVDVATLIPSKDPLEHVDVERLMTIASPSEQVFKGWTLSESGFSEWEAKTRGENDPLDCTGVHFHSFDPKGHSFNSLIERAKPGTVNMDNIFRNVGLWDVKPKLTCDRLMNIAEKAVDGSLHETDFSCDYESYSGLDETQATQKLSLLTRKVKPGMLSHTPLARMVRFDNALFRAYLIAKGAKDETYGTYMGELTFQDDAQLDCSGLYIGGRFRDRDEFTAFLKKVVPGTLNLKGASYWFEFDRSLMDLYIKVAGDHPLYLSECDRRSDLPGLLDGLEVDAALLTQILKHRYQDASLDLRKLTFISDDTDKVDFSGLSFSHIMLDKEALAFITSIAAPGTLDLRDAYFQSSFKIDASTWKSMKVACAPWTAPISYVTFDGVIVDKQELGHMRALSSSQEISVKGCVFVDEKRAVDYTDICFNGVSFDTQSLTSLFNNAQTRTLDLKGSNVQRVTFNKPLLQRYLRCCDQTPGHELVDAKFEMGMDFSRLSFDTCPVSLSTFNSMKANAKEGSLDMSGRPLKGILDHPQNNKYSRLSMDHLDAIKTGTLDCTGVSFKGEELSAQHMHRLVRCAKPGTLDLSGIKLPSRYCSDAYTSEDFLALAKYVTPKSIDLTFALQKNIQINNALLSALFTMATDKINVDQGSFSGVQFDETTLKQLLACRSDEYSNIDLTGATYVGDTLRDVTINRIDWPGLVLKDVTMERVIWRGVECPKATFTGGHMTSVEWRSSTLIGASFNDVDMTDVVVGGFCSLRYVSGSLSVSLRSRQTSDSNWRANYDDRLDYASMIDSLPEEMRDLKLKLVGEWVQLLTGAEESIDYHQWVSIFKTFWPYVYQPNIQEWITSLASKSEWGKGGPLSFLSALVQQEGPEPLRTRLIESVLSQMDPLCIPTADLMYSYHSLLVSLVDSVESQFVYDFIYNSLEAHCSTSYVYPQLWHGNGDVSFLDKIDRLPETLHDKKVRLLAVIAGQLMEADLSSVDVHSLFNVMGTYTDDPLIREFVLNKLWPCVMEGAADSNRDIDPHVLDVMAKLLCTSVEDALRGEGAVSEAGISADAVSCVNQVLLASRRRRGTHTENVAKLHDLWRQLLKKLELDTACETAGGLDPEETIFYFELQPGARPTHFITVDVDALGSFLDPNMTEGGGSLFQQFDKQDNVWRWNENADKEKMLRPFSVLIRRYRELNSEECRRHYIHLLFPEDSEFSEHIIQAFRVSRIQNDSKKWVVPTEDGVTDEKQQPLMPHIYPHIIRQPGQVPSLPHADDETSFEVSTAHCTLTEAHKQSIIDAFQCQGASHEELAILFASLAATMSMLSAKEMFGVPGRSPKPIRDYALALLNVSHSYGLPDAFYVEECLVNPVDRHGGTESIFQNVQRRLGGESFSCTSIVFFMLSEELRVVCKENRAFASIRNMAIPSVW